MKVWAKPSIAEALVVALGAFPASFGDNYKIEVVASGGFNTGETQSASAFAVVGEQRVHTYYSWIAIIYRSNC